MNAEFWPHQEETHHSSNPTTQSHAPTSRSLTDWSSVGQQTGIINSAGTNTKTNSESTQMPAQVYHTEGRRAETAADSSDPYDCSGRMTYGEDAQKKANAKSKVANKGNQHGGGGKEPDGCCCCCCCGDDCCTGGGTTSASSGGDPCGGCC